MLREAAYALVNCGPYIKMMLRELRPLSDDGGFHATRGIGAAGYYRGESFISFERFTVGLN
ncbi:hypothetical protein EYF80_061510 [Liparis tanakae]|uniref:Uncharacterized protein n=1 Tax=Liparis tanakae TaxID=230148 RepID=A0A4Z2EHQ2_9TELE|nr:hypothetical protein EYF80_061510 [Liparis tanakae]